MRLKTLGNQMRVYLNPHDYETLLDCADSRRAHLAIRLMGESSLRVGTLSREISPGDVRRSTHPDVDIWFLSLSAKDTKDRDTDGKRRDVWVPQSLKAELDRYCDDENIDDDDPLFGCVRKTLRNEVKRSAANAARQTGNDDFEHVSAHDLRAYFATTMLIRHNVSKDTVLELGGWENYQSIQPYLDASFDDIIQDDLAAAGVLEIESVDATSETAQLREEVNALREVVGDLADEVQEISAGLEDLTVEVTIDEPDPQSDLTDFGAEISPGT